MHPQVLRAAKRQHRPSELDAWTSVDLQRQFLPTASGLATIVRSAMTARTGSIAENRITGTTPTF
jgi:hypothetical protein